MKNITRVRRDGMAIEIEAEGLVPGDIVLMEAGTAFRPMGDCSSRQPSRSRKPP